MEEEKAAAYYEELTRKGEGAARFKQGLGFSTSSPAAKTDAFPARGSALPSSSSSFLGQFVRASSPNSTSKLEKESEIQSIKEKLKKKPDDRTTERIRREGDERKGIDRRRGRSRSRSRERDDGDQINRRRNRSTSREISERDRRNRRRSKSRSRSIERGDRDRLHRRRGKSRSRSRSRDKHSDREREKDMFGHRDRRSQDQRRERRSERGNELKNGKQDYSRLIEGYNQLTASERVKAKMKQQLAETADKDTTMGVGWERFEFDKDAQLDDEEVEAAEDDVALVKQIGQSFRFSAIETRREQQIIASHDEAMFGAPTCLVAATTEDNSETDSAKKDCDKANAAASLLSEKVLAKQQGSWRDRARKT